MNCFYELPGDLVLNDAGDFGVFSVVSVSEEVKHETPIEKKRGKYVREFGKIREEHSENSGNFRSTTFLTFKKRLQECHHPRGQKT